MIVIIGVGALGSHVALLARNLGQPLRLVDFDRVEMKNTQAQFHTKMGLGRNKAQAISQVLNGMWGLRCEANTNKLTRENAGAILGGATLILDCTDNAAARTVIQTYAREHKVPCLHGAMSAAGDFGRVVWDEQFVIDAEGAPGQATCEDGVALPFFAAVAGMMVQTVQTFLKGGKKTNLQMNHGSLIRF